MKDSQVGYSMTSAHLPFASASVGAFSSLRAETDMALTEATFGLHLSSNSAMLS